MMQVVISPRRLSVRAFYLAVAVAFLPGAAAASDQGLFATTSQHPFIQIYSLPSPAEHPVLPAGALTWRLAFDLSNNAIAEATAAGERIVLDGETYRTSISLAYGVSERFTAEILLPLVVHSGGMLDSLIHEWHRVFGVSNVRRDAFERYQLEYAYIRNGEEQLVLADRDRGAGDIRLNADWRLRVVAPEGRSLVLRSGVKLPTGSSRALRGSGSTDFSLQLLSTDGKSLAGWNTTLYWMFGALWLGESEVLDGLRRDAVAIGSAGVSRPIWRKLTARVQLDGHSAFYDSALRPLGGSALQISFGGSIQLARAGRIDVAVVENLFTDTTPDFGIHLGWRGGF